MSMAEPAGVAQSQTELGFDRKSGFGREANRPRILMVEDDARLAGFVSDYLARHEMRVDHESRGDEAVHRIIRDEPDLVLLDMMLPGLDGFEICRRVRFEFSGPIVVLTARTEDVDQVSALESGADDYVVKPVEPRVLLARIRAHLRRSAPSGTGSSRVLEFGDLVIDYGRREVRREGSDLALTCSEFDLLWALASRAGTPIDRETLLAALRGIDYDGLDRSIDVCVSKLRQKIGDDPRNPSRIKTVRGVGYLFADGDP